jgi:hypothetical protein
MAAVPVTFQGILFFSDVGVGGGPMPGGPIASHPIAPGGPPLGIWGGPPLYPDQGLPGPQPPGGGVGIWPSPGHPAHPIAPGGPPPSIWPSPGRPTHPIAPGGPPLGIWGGPPLYPDQGLPGPQPTPTPPIYLPPGAIPGLKPEHPIYIPPSSGVPGVPTHPIVLPPTGSPPDQKPEVLENWDVKAGWSPQTGWVVAIVPSESHPGLPTPSAPGAQPAKK